MSGFGYMMDTEAPKCPVCHRLPWHEGRMVRVENKEPAPDAQLEMTLCVHCFTPAVLVRDDRGMPKEWRSLTDEELVMAAEMIADVTRRYRRGRDGGALQ